MGTIEERLDALERVQAGFTAQVGALDEGVRTIEEHHVRFRTVVLPAVQSLIGMLAEDPRTTHTDG